MRRAAWLLAAHAALGLVAACGSDASDPSLNTTRPPASFAEYEALYGSLTSAWSGAAATDPALLPASGSASYEGVLRMTADTATGPEAIDGALQLSANFGSDTVSGSAGSFLGQSGASYTGNLTISAGVIDRAADPVSGYAVAADIAGALSGSADSLSLAGRLDADFLGSGAGAMRGIVQGTSTNASGTGIFFGDFIAAR